MEIEIPNAELIDKITILSLKKKFITDVEKLKNVNKEYDSLYKKMLTLNFNESNTEYIKLLAVNEKLWIVEDQLRDKERDKIFDQEFIDLARQVYHLNDERAKIKKDINIKTNSAFVEEKSYKNY